MKKRRAVVTGIGVVTPIRMGKEAFWAGVRAGRSPVHRLTRFESQGLRCKIAAEIDRFDLLEFIEPKRLRHLDRYAQLSIAVETIISPLKNWPGVTD